MYDERWPIRTYQPNFPPPKFVFAEEGLRRPPRRGARQHRLPGLDHLRRHASSDRSLGPTRASTALPTCEDSILFDGVDIGRHARIRRAIIDKGVHIPARHRDRLRPRARPRPRLHRQRRRRSRHRQGRRRRPFPRSRSDARVSRLGLGWPRQLGCLGPAGTRGPCELRAVQNPLPPGEGGSRQRTG